MGPAIPVIITVAKVAGVVLATKTAIEGLKEGNLLKAALGGVGAYFGLSSLGAFGAAQGAALGTGVGDQTGLVSAVAKGSAPAGLENVGASLGTTVAQSANEGILSGAGGFASQAARDAITPNFANAASNVAGSVGANAAGSGLGGLATSAANAGKGLLSSAGGALSQGYGPVAAIVGGQALQGYVQGKQQEEILDRTDEREDESRARRGAGASGIEDEQRDYLATHAQNLFNPRYTPPVIRRA
jgi:hypothetical protein